jgi:TRAP-type C4-dicarboxylate transport system permease small subunit
VPGDYDLAGIICGSAVFAFLPYCQMTRGNVMVDFFTGGMRPRAKSVFDAFGTLLYLVIAVMFAWRLYYGMIELRDSHQVLAVVNFYRWWTVPFDLFCLLVLIAVIAYTLARDVDDARTGKESAKSVG